MSTLSVSTQTQQVTQSLSANTAEQGDPKLKKKFLLTKPTYRPCPRSRDGGIACHQPPPRPPPGSMPLPSSLTASGLDPPLPSVQCRNGAKIAHTAATHRLESGAKIYFDCRCTTASPPGPPAHLQPCRRHPSPWLQLTAIIPDHHPAAMPPRSLFFRFFCLRKNEKAVKIAIY